MTDDKTLVARLRAENAMRGLYGPPALQIEAADRIEALEKDNAELRHDIARHVAAVAAERNAALEEAKAALKDLWFGDEVARPGSLDAMEAVDALMARGPIVKEYLIVARAPAATCNENLQVGAPQPPGDGQ